jgi:mycothiol synthase
LTKPHCDKISNNISILIAGSFNPLDEISDMDEASGLSFRCYQGIEDIPKILSVTASSAEADKSNYAGDSIETVSCQFEQMTNCDPFRDVLLAEVDDEVIGYVRCFWECEGDGNGSYLYDFVRHLVPAFRCHPVGETMLNLIEHRLREIADEHPSENLKFFQNYVTEDEIYWRSLLEDLGYEPVHYEHNMLRLNSEEVPTIALPEGLEIRVVEPEHYRNIWESDNEAFQGSWGFVQPTESDYRYWISDKQDFQPYLWQVAWDMATGKVAGQVQACIHDSLNAKLGRKQGFIGPISVCSLWRKKGIARALLTRSLKLLQRKEITEVFLNVDTDNKDGATRLYESCGFRTVKQNAVYRKPLTKNSF